MADKEILTKRNAEQKTDKTVLVPRVYCLKVVFIKAKDHGDEDEKTLGTK